jgi:multimeric flavodoxin WrbA
MPEHRLFSKMGKIVILGSSRQDGDTATVVECIKKHSSWVIVDLNNYQISYYDYDHANKGDDYLPLMREIIEHYDTIIFVTPVYWYAMSGIMKVFFDRISDLLTIEKELGRKLRDKKMAALSCSVGNHLGEAFWLPFSETAKYLGMDFLGGLHIIVGEDYEQEIEAFIRDIESK